MPPLSRGIPPLRNGVLELRPSRSVLDLHHQAISLDGTGVEFNYDSDSETSQFVKISGGSRSGGYVIVTNSSTTPETPIDQKERYLQFVEKIADLQQKASQLHQRLRPYTTTNPAETWASRWIAAPIAYLFPEIRREEWLGDLYETNREMLLNRYPRWFVNLNNILRSLALVESSLRVKITEWMAMFSQK